MFDRRDFETRSEEARRRMAVAFWLAPAIFVVGMPAFLWVAANVPSVPRGVVKALSYGILVGAQQTWRDTCLRRYAAARTAVDSAHVDSTGLRESSLTCGVLRQRGSLSRPDR